MRFVMLPIQRVLSGALQRLDGAGFIEMHHGIELVGQLRIEVVAPALRALAAHVAIDAISIWPIGFNRDDSEAFFLDQSLRNSGSVSAAGRSLGPSL